MSKRTVRTLYEMMGREREGPPRERVRPKPPAEEPAASPRLRELLAGGRTLRVPVGYVLLGAAAVLLLLVGAFMIGHRRGEEKMQAELDRNLLDGGGDVARDPLAIDTTALGPAAPPRFPPAAGGGPAGAASPWGAIESDPRERGVHYLVIATTRPDGAVRLAAFCRERGLAAYVVSDNNLRRRRVIVLPGFESRTDPQIRELRDRVSRVGRAWKDEHTGESDLSDSFLNLHEG